MQFGISVRIHGSEQGCEIVVRRVKAWRSKEGYGIKRRQRLFIQTCKISKKRIRYMQRSRVSLIISSEAQYVYESAGLGARGRLFAVDVGASQTAEEGKLESVKSLS